MPCGCSSIQISSVGPYASLKDVAAAFQMLSNCCRGEIANDTDPLDEPVAAMAEGFPDGFESGCECDLLWLIKPSGTTYFSADAGATWHVLVTLDEVESLFASPPAIGSSTPAAGTFTSLAATSVAVAGNISTTGEIEIDGNFNHDGSNIGFFGTAPTTKKTVTGSRGGNAALNSLLSALSAYGIVTDSSTA